MMRLTTVYCMLALLLSRSGIGNERPNVLFIYTDDQTFRTLSCYRDQGAWPWVDTPQIDRLANEGMRFTSAYGAAWCSPSRACVLTGKLPHNIHGLKLTAVVEGSYDPKICRFWPAELRKQGYETALIGKWHLGHDSGHGRDWDHSVVWDQSDIKTDWYNDQILSIDGDEKKVVPGYSTDIYTQFAQQFISKQHQKPWLLWLCYNAPHNPQTIADRHRDRYSQEAVALPVDVFGPRQGKPGYQQTFTQWKPPIDSKHQYPQNGQGRSLDQIVREYNRVVCALDEGVGSLLSTLEKSGQLDDTLIIFTSDQGFAWGEHGFAWKVGPYDACLKMPLLIRYPKRIPVGRVCHRPVTVVDLAPTIMSLTSSTLPWTSDGHDLTSLLIDETSEPDRTALMEFFRWEFGSETDNGLTNGRAMSQVPWWIFLRHAKYKYIRTLLPDEIDELYDLEADPDELNNLALRGDHQDLLNEYRKRLIDELIRTKAALVPNVPVPKADVRN